MRTMPPLLAPLFRSAGQAAIVAEVLLGGDVVGLSALAVRAGVPKSSAHREVKRLQEAGLFLVETVGREWQIRPNPASPLTAPVREIAVLAFGPVPMLRAGLEVIAGVEVALIFGSFAARAAGVLGRSPRDVDVLVVGGADPAAVYDVCRSVEDVIHRPVNATVMTRKEWDDALRRESAFVVDLLGHPTVPVIGEL